MRPSSPLVKRVDHAMKLTGVRYEELVAWSTHLANVSVVTCTEEDKPNPKYVQMIKHQAAVIDQSIDFSKTLSKRVRKIESEHGSEAEVPTV